VTLHLIKLCVGCDSIEDLAQWQKQRLARLRKRDPKARLRHVTRNRPRRAAEVLDGGSLYWVISGSMLVRQRISDIIDDKRDDGTPCTALVLDPKLVPLVGRPTRPFQGWRYLDADDAPPDEPPMGAVLGLDILPAALKRELRALCLL
jgi:hypothetical protein